MVWAQATHLMLHLFVTNSDLSLLYLIQTNDTTRSVVKFEAHCPWHFATAEFLPVHLFLVMKLDAEIQRHRRSFTVFSKYTIRIC